MDHDSIQRSSWDLRANTLSIVSFKVTGQSTIIQSLGSYIYRNEKEMSMYKCIQCYLIYHTCFYLFDDL